MIVSTKGRYALRLLIDIAMNQGEGNVAIRSIAERQNISEKYMETIAKQLVSARLLRSARGKNGGYHLTRPAQEITVADIVSAMEGDLVSVSCYEQNGEPCARMAQCRTVGVWRGLDKVVTDYLEGISLADLSAPELPANDYVI